MLDQDSDLRLSARTLSVRSQAVLILVMFGVGLGGLSLVSRARTTPGKRPEAAGQSRSEQVFRPTPAQWASLTTEPVEVRDFRREVTTDARIGVNEDQSTPIFSPYSGLVKRLAVKPGDDIARGQLLFTVEATDMVQAQNDFITSLAALETARSQLKLSQINEKRQHELYEAKAVPLKEWQQSQAELIAAENGVRSAEIALEAVRNRLRILQKTEREISDFEKTGKINPETPIYAPISGTIVQRKVGPGQYVISGASDPVFVVGDLSTVWLIANVRETDASQVAVGEMVRATVLAYPERVFTATLDYVGASVDATTRRLQVRATVANPEKLLKPEMFASASILTGSEQSSPAVPRDALIYEGDNARVWIAADDQTLALRPVKLGVSSGNLIQIIEGLHPGEKVVTRGSLFIDRAANGPS